MKKPIKLVDLNGREYSVHAFSYGRSDRVMKKPTRLVDLNGEVINSPQGYHEALNTLKGFVDSMEESQVDRADMQVIIADLFDEVRFHMKFLGRRQTNEL